jgi:hypothetical protein
MDEKEVKSVGSPHLGLSTVLPVVSMTDVTRSSSRCYVTLSRSLSVSCAVCCMCRLRHRLLVPDRHSSPPIATMRIVFVRSSTSCEGTEQRIFCYISVRN